MIEGTERGLGVVKPECCKIGEIKETELGEGRQPGVKFVVVEVELDVEAELDKDKGSKRVQYQHSIQHLLN